MLQGEAELKLSVAKGFPDICIHNKLAECHVKAAAVSQNIRVSKYFQVNSLVSGVCCLWEAFFIFNVASTFRF